MEFIEKYKLWLDGSFIDEKTKEELRSLENQSGDTLNSIEDRFYKDLEFGTAGLRGIIGAGTNRMNQYTVGRATQGLANYLIKQYHSNISVAIAYDCRIMSYEFACVTANVLDANGIKAYVYDGMRSTPQLSFAVRKLKCHAGIVITASHNPYNYNGYKVYNCEGGQITEQAANMITEEISRIDYTDIKYSQSKNYINLIEKSVDDLYMEQVKGLRINKEIEYTLKIVYTPLNGTGNIPVTKVLTDIGFKNLIKVREQEQPDGMFPTVKYPNPENYDVYKLAIKYATENDADIIIATDPDCDRVGVVVKDIYKNEYVRLTGNQVGALLLQYILKSHMLNNTLVKNPVIINSIVTDDLSEKIGKSYGATTIKTLTGFKYIAENIEKLSKDPDKNFIFGYEESCGYLAGDFVRDKDGVIASMLVAEMCAYYKKIGKTLIEVLNDMYNEYGYCIDDVLSFTVDGITGQSKISKVLEYFRENKPVSIGGCDVASLCDYKLSMKYDLITGSFSKIELPKSNVLKFCFNDGSWFVLRPSGTEPKIKMYFSLCGKVEQETKERLDRIKNEVVSIFNCIV